MKVRYQADADLNRHILFATLRHEAAVDFQSATEADLPGLSDPEVLALTADQGRVLVTHDGRTMPHHFASFVARRESPGVLVVPQHLPVATAAEELFLVWLTTTADEWTNRLCWIPM